MQDLSKRLGLTMSIIALVTVIYNTWQANAKMESAIWSVENRIEIIEAGSNGKLTEIVKDIEKIFEDLEWLDDIKEAKQVVSGISDDVEDLIQWKEDWQVRVLPLDTEQDWRISENKKEIEKLRAKIGE